MDNAKASQDSNNPSLGEVTLRLYIFTSSTLPVRLSSLFQCDVMQLSCTDEATIGEGVNWNDCITRLG